MRRPAILGVLLLSGALASCVSFAWSRGRRFEPPPPDALPCLEPGRTTLAQCLERLGAPLYVWEHAGDGMALAWGWSERVEKGVSVGVPLQEHLSASMSYDDVDQDLRGAVLLFDRELVLEQVREGWLRDLERETGRRRPASTEAARGP